MRYSCLGCNMASQCCNTFEYCVSCCLDPSRTSSDLALKPKLLNRSQLVQARRYLSIAQVDVGTIQQVHENVYVSDEHHCFVYKEQYPVEDEEAERGDTDFGDLTIVISRQGQSCESACGERQKTWKLSMLPALNKCLV
ncbi:hypothetical protein R1flu_025235 [Riccia fluitans]|uniref:SREBP regulating gene protein n=1 Tax=Riccia fluitans TaxID=41844 RepID=A0ABD1Y1C3_9MARC